MNCVNQMKINRIKLHSLRNHMRKLIYCTRGELQAIKKQTEDSQRIIVEKDKSIQNRDIILDIFQSFSQA